MKKETLEILEKKIKTCPDCSKEFLGIAISGGTDPAHTWKGQVNISTYPLECNKCPKCAEKCFENVEKTKKIPCIDDIDYNIDDYGDLCIELDCYCYFQYTYTPDTPYMGELIDLFERI